MSKLSRIEDNLYSFIFPGPMHISEVDYTNVIVFAHEDDDKVQRLFNISSLMADPRVQRHTIRKIDVNPHYAKLALESWGVEYERLQEIWRREEWKEEPILMADTEDTKHIMIDGNHRYVKAALQEREWIYAKMLRKRIWERHLITGATDEQMKILLDQSTSSYNFFGTLGEFLKGGSSGQRQQWQSSTSIFSAIQR